MVDKYDPYTVTNGKEEIVIDENDNLWAGSWQRENMLDVDKINIGTYHDPTSGPKEVAGMTKEALSKHTVISGRSGYGKSTVLTNIQTQLLNDGHGMCFIDARGDEAKTLVEKIPESRTDDLVWLNLSADIGGDTAVGFNIFETGFEKGSNKYETEVQSRVDDLLVLIQENSRNWGSQISNTIEVLIESAIRSEKNYTLADLLDVLPSDLDMDAESYDTEPEKLKEEVKNRDQSAYENLEELDESFSELSSYLRSWLENEATRRVMASNETHMTVTECVEDGKILIVNTGNIYDDKTKEIVTRVIIEQVWQAIRPRKHNSREMKPYYLFINEYDIVFSNYNINEIISLARSFNLGVFLTISHLSQMEDDAEAAVRQCHNHIALNPGSSVSEAASVAQLFNTGAENMQNLDPHNAMFYPISDSGYIADEPFVTSLFAELPPCKNF